MYQCTGARLLLPEAENSSLIAHRRWLLRWMLTGKGSAAAHLSLTEQQGSISSSLAATLAGRSLATLFRYTIGVLPAHCKSHASARHKCNLYTLSRGGLATLAQRAQNAWPKMCLNRLALCLCNIGKASACGGHQSVLALRTRHDQAGVLSAP